MPVSQATREAALAAIPDDWDPAAESVAEDKTPAIDLTAAEEPAKEGAAKENKPEEPAKEEEADEAKEEPKKDEPPKEKTAEEKKQELAAERLAKARTRDERSVKRELEAKQMLAEAQKIRTELEQERAAMQALKEKLKNPETRIQAVRDELGVSYEDYTRAYLSGGKRTPEDDIQELRSEIQRLAEEKKQAETQAQTQAYQSAIAEAAAYVESEPEKYPTLYSEHSAQEIRARFHQAVQDLNRYNANRRAQGLQVEVYNDTQIAEYLEEQAKKEYDAKEARRSRVRGQGNVGSTAAGKSAGKVITSETANGSSQRALTREERRELALKSPWPT